MPKKFDIKLQRVLERSMANDRRKRRRRPTAAGVVIHQYTGEVLIVFGTPDEVNASENPGIVKGGIERRESLVEALLREIEEELGISPQTVDILGYLGRHDVKSLKQKGGYTRKRYYVALVMYRGKKEIEINPSEVTGYVWVSLEQVREVIGVLKHHRPEKHRALASIFTDLRRKLRKKRLAQKVMRNTTPA